jgi:prephenate dehydratase
MANKLKIGLSGTRGSFSEEAAQYYCRQQKLTDFELEYLFSVENVLKALADAKIDLGIFPIENSNGGIVYEAVEAMSRHNFSIEGMFEIDVRHCLLIRPRLELTKITKIISHPQGLKQCRMYLKRRWPNIELEEYIDTAAAAADLASGKLPATAAVIASASCADLYGLEIAEKNIQDLKFNFTTFIAARRRD